MKCTKDKTRQLIIKCLSITECRDLTSFKGFNKIFVIIDTIQQMKSQIIWTQFVQFLIFEIG